MNIVSTLLKPELVVAHLDVASKKRLLEEAGRLLAEAYSVSAGDVFDSLLSREKLGSTALGYGIAIPHGRIKGLKDTACAFLRLTAPVDYDAPDGMPVDLVFVLLAPHSATDLHLQILAELAQMFSLRDMRERLRKASNASELYTLISSWTP